MSKSTSGRSTPASAALLKLLELPDLRERFALCLMNVYGDEKRPGLLATPSRRVRGSSSPAKRLPRQGHRRGAGRGLGALPEHG